MFTKTILRKKFIPGVAIFLCMMIVASTSISAHAASSEAPVPSTSQLSNLQRMTLISNCYCIISVRGGNATATAYVSGYMDSTTRCQIILKIQENDGTGWETVGNWSLSEYDEMLSLSRSVNITSGYEYRAQATVTVWSVAQSESLTITTEGEEA